MSLPNQNDMIHVTIKQEDELDTNEELSMSEFNDDPQLEWLNNILVKEERSQTPIEVEVEETPPQPPKSRVKRAEKGNATDLILKELKIMRIMTAKLIVGQIKTEALCRELKKENVHLRECMRKTRLGVMNISLSLVNKRFITAAGTCKDDKIIQTPEELVSLNNNLPEDDNRFEYISYLSGLCDSDDILKNATLFKNVLSDNCLLGCNMNGSQNMVNLVEQKNWLLCLSSAFNVTHTQLTKHLSLLRIKCRNRARKKMNRQ